MELKLCTFCELERLYNDEMRFDFPQSELKPLQAMGRLMEQGRYQPLAALDGGDTLGYALVWLSPERQGGLLDYLAVLRGRRDQGLGGKILTLLGDRYSQLFVEAEAPSSPDPAENHLRLRRLDFYCRNGFRPLDYQCALFGVHFNCLYRGPETDHRKVEALHRSVYADYFSPAHMARFIQIPLAPGEAIHPAPSWVEEDEESIFS